MFEGGETCAPALEISANTTTIHGHFRISPPMDLRPNRVFNPASAARLFKTKLHARAQYSNAGPRAADRVVDGSDGVLSGRNSTAAAAPLPEFISRDSVSSIHSTFTLVAEALNTRKEGHYRLAEGLHFPQYSKPREPYATRDFSLVSSN